MFIEQISWRNEMQVVLWNEELIGQLSDGNWENSRPYEHWKRPCRAEVAVASPSTQLGPNFTPARKYNFKAVYSNETVRARMLVALHTNGFEGTTEKMLAYQLHDMSVIFNSRYSGTPLVADEAKY